MFVDLILNSMGSGIEQMDKQLKDKENQVNDLKKDKEAMQKDKDNLWKQIAEMQTARAKLDAELTASKSMNSTITTMRTVLEIYVNLLAIQINSQYPGKKITMTDGIDYIVKHCIELKGNKMILRPDAEDDMTALEGRVIQGVVNELEDLMNRVSLDHHHLKPIKAMDPGFICGGQSPLRVATAIAMIAAQRLLVKANMDGYAKFPIRYCNDNWLVTNTFIGGKISKV
jgi:hypothetical protein